MPCSFRILVCLALIAWSGMAAAVVYKWTDAQGKLQYGDSPPAGVHVEVVELLGIHAARSESNKPSNAATPARAPQSAPPSGRPTAGEIQKTIDQDVAQAHEKQCADAQERYRQLIEGRHLYRQGADGEREYLTSEQIDSERIIAKRAADAACDGTT